MFSVDASMRAQNNTAERARKCTSSRFSCLTTKDVSCSCRFFPLFFLIPLNPKKNVLLGPLFDVMRGLCTNQLLFTELGHQISSVSDSDFSSRFDFSFLEENEEIDEKAEFLIMSANFKANFGQIVQNAEKSAEKESFFADLNAKEFAFSKTKQTVEESFESDSESSVSLESVEITPPVSRKSKSKVSLKSGKVFKVKTATQDSIAQLNSSIAPLNSSKENKRNRSLSPVTKKVAKLEKKTLPSQGNQKLSKKEKQRRAQKKKGELEETGTEMLYAKNICNRYDFKEVF